MKKLLKYKQHSCRDVDKKQNKVLHTYSILPFVLHYFMPSKKYDMKKEKKKRKRAREVFFVHILFYKSIKDKNCDENLISDCSVLLFYFILLKMFQRDYFSFHFISFLWNFIFISFLRNLF